MTQTTKKNAPAAGTGRGGANNQQAAGIFASHFTRNRRQLQSDAERREPTPELLREMAEDLDLQIRRCEFIKQALLIEAALLERGDL